MKELKHNLISFLCVGLLGIGIVSILRGNPNSEAVASQPKQYAQTLIEEEDEEDKTPTNSNNRPLKISISVDHPSHLKIKEGDEIKEGDILVDNSLERERLNRQKQAVLLQIQNLQAKKLLPPTPPPPPPALLPLPPAAYAQEEAAISQAQLRLSQAKSLLAARSSILKAENPEIRAEVEKAVSVQLQVKTKVEEQEKMLQTMQDMKMEQDIILHETSVLEKIKKELEQSTAQVNQTQAKLEADGIGRTQQLQQLEINVQLAESELIQAQARLTSARNNRQMNEYQASIEASKKAIAQEQTQQEYTRQRIQYEQAIRDKDYQLAQLQISLASVEDKIFQLPVVRSPRSGVIKKIKPWTGRDGKYQTTLTIISYTSTNSSSRRTGPNN